jgi:hypothetical protein
MIRNQSHYDRTRRSAYYHCKERVYQRYDKLDLTFDLWLRMHNQYYLNKYETKIEDNRGQLIVFHLICVKFFAFFSPEYNIFMTFLDPKKGAYGTCEWKNSKIVRY